MLFDKQRSFYYNQIQNLERAVEWWNGGLVVSENLRIFWSPPYVHVNEGKL